ncbi:Gfo/Idh/MocA family protein [Halobacterium salinarum]|nr:putative dehydrogenase [Halobacterium salinarum DSM 3754]
MGRHHARVYSEIPESSLSGIYDVDDEQAAQVAAENGTKPRGLEELLTRVDAVSIAVPTIHHYEIAKQCIEHGVHVLVEKPFVDEQQQGEELIELAEENDVQIQVGHIERFNPAVVALKDIIPDIDIISVKAERLGPPLDRTMNDSVVKDLMIHDIDILLWLIDENVSSVSALDSDEAYTTANFEFEDGSIGSLTASRVTQRKVRTLTITTHSCRIDVDYIDQSVEVYRHSLPEYIEENGDVRYRHESIVERPMVENEEPLKSELSSFIDSVRSNETPEVSGRDGLRAVEYVNKIEKMANSEDNSK